MMGFMNPKRYTPEPNTSRRARQDIEAVACMLSGMSGNIEVSKTYRVAFCLAGHVDLDW